MQQAQIFHKSAGTRRLSAIYERCVIRDTARLRARLRVLPMSRASALQAHAGRDHTIDFRQGHLRLRQKLRLVLSLMTFSDCPRAQYQWVPYGIRLARMMEQTIALIDKSLYSRNLESRNAGMAKGRAVAILLEGVEKSGLTLTCNHARPLTLAERAYLSCCGRWHRQQGERHQGRCLRRNGQYVTHRFTERRSLQ